MIQVFLASILPGATDPYVSGAATLVGVVAIMRLVKEFRTLTQEEPRPAQTYATKVECQTHIAQISRRLDMLEADARAYRENADTMRREVKSDLAELQRKLSTDIRAVHSRVDDLPAQIIATLRNAGAIGPHHG